MKKLLIVFIVIIVVLVLFYVWRGLVSPTPVEAPVKPAESTFQGPPPGPAGGFKGPTGPPPL